MRIQINEWTRDQRHRCRQWFATDQVMFIDFLKRQIPRDEQFRDNRYTCYVYQRVLSWRRFTKIRSHFHITWHPYLNKFLQVWRGRNMHAFLWTPQKYEYTQAKLIAINTEIFSRQPFSFLIAPDQHGHGMTISLCFLKSIKVIKFGNNVKIITSEYSLHCLDNITQIFETKFWIITARWLG